MNQKSDVVVRFAPSPTGYLHIGSARTAMFNALMHLKNGGRFIFRIEDTDSARDIAGAGEKLLADLNWLGIKFTEGEGIGGSSGPYRQSQRLNSHLSALEVLVANNTAYHCFCTEERIIELHAENKRLGLPPRYDRLCKSLSDKEIYARHEAGEKSVIRLAVDPQRVIEINDLVKGTVTFTGVHLDDPVLIRSDGIPTGLLAGAIDDWMMGVTHIFRAEEWLPSTPYQSLIFQGLGGPVPSWGHISLLVDENHAKLSKRTAGLSVSGLREEGILPEAICRYLAGLGRGTIPPERGWSLQDLAEAFEPTNYRSGEIIYTKSALLQENQRYLRILSSEEFRDQLFNWLRSENIDCSVTGDEQSTLIEMSRESSSTLSECLDEINAILLRPNLSGAELLEFSNASATFEHLLDALFQIEWNETQIMDAIKSTGKVVGVKGRELFFPIRLAMSGRTHGPKLGAIMEVLGREESFERIKYAINFTSL